MGFLSKLFGKEDEGEKQLREMTQKIWQIIDDEKFQNSLVSDLRAEKIKNGASIDQLPNGIGEFGLEEGNPIPVNGAIGELAYLSRLETAQGERLLFHRIGAINMIDVFEAVTYSGSAWFLFYMDIYHPRRSRKAPLGFRIASEPRQFSGFHGFCRKFPYDYPETRHALPESIVSIAYIPTGNVIPQLQKLDFTRPLGHKLKLDVVMGKTTSRTVVSVDNPDTSNQHSPIAPEQLDKVPIFLIADRVNSYIELIGQEDTLLLEGENVAHFWMLALPAKSSGWVGGNALFEILKENLVNRHIETDIHISSKGAAEFIQAVESVLNDPVDSDSLDILRIFSCGQVVIKAGG